MRRKVRFRGRISASFESSCPAKRPDTGCRSGSAKEKRALLAREPVKRSSNEFSESETFVKSPDQNQSTVECHLRPLKANPQKPNEQQSRQPLSALAHSPLNTFLMMLRDASSLIFEAFNGFCDVLKKEI
jgi:hypothetical protein